MRQTDSEINSYTNTSTKNAKLFRRLLTLKIKAIAVGNVRI